MDYTQLKPASPEAAAEKGLSLEQARQDPAMRRATPEELAIVEAWLDVRAGTLAGLEFWSSRVDDANGVPIGIVNIVLTALIDAGHSKSFILHTLLGNKLILSPVHPVRDSGGKLAATRVNYTTNAYWCIIPAQM